MNGSIQWLGRRCLHLGSYDVLVVGGGIVGVAAAREIAITKPSISVGLVEKESALAKHQSGHNSGVIHAGIYYAPGSQRTKLCIEGLQLSYEYFNKKSVPYKRVGKLIVATHEGEVPRLMQLYERGIKNGVPELKLIDGSEICKIEPHCKGVKAIHSPHTGIVDWGSVCRDYFATDFQEAGGKIHLSFEVCNIEENKCLREGSKYPIRVKAKDGDYVTCAYLLCCGGLYSDKLSMMSGGSHKPPIVPVRGEYLILDHKKSHLVNGNIYPVPDPRMPFLGVHFTPRLDGTIWLGPNAVLAGAREGYTYSDIKVSELWESLSYRGVQRLAFKYFDFGAKEFIKSIFISLSIKDLQRYIPEIGVNDIRKGPAGVRAQAIAEDGNLIEDFIFDSGSGLLKNRVLHCRNAPSPGATSSLAIAKVLSKRMEIMLST